MANDSITIVQVGSQSNSTLNRDTIKRQLGFSQSSLHPYSLEAAEAVLHPANMQTINNVTSKYNFYEFQLKGSVVKQIVVPSIVCILWSLLIC
ncbi:hypothetical protein HDU91_007264, partial [Kappamyces sp. JEL0680]